MLVSEMIDFFSKINNNVEFGDYSQGVQIVAYKPRFQIYHIYIIYLRYIVF